MFRRSFSSEDSELSESLINSKSAIRVSVCLQRYFKDVRARCYILVVRNRRVRWLEKRIQRIFALPGSFCLSTNGHLLPSSEPLALLRPEDSIEVIPLLEAHTGMLQKNDATGLAVNNVLEKHSKNGERLSDSSELLTDVHNSGSKHHQMNIDEADCNETPKTFEEDGDTYNLETNDDIDGARTLYSPSPSGDSNLTINNNNRDMNGSYKPKTMSHTLQQLKRKALALLDAQRSAIDADEAVEDEPPPRRVRRRVRRRPRRPLQAEPRPAPEPEPELAPGPEPAPELEPEQEPHYQPVLEPEPESRSSTSSHTNSEPEPPVEVPAGRAGASPPREVARNEAARSRRPRVVRALDEN